MDKSEKKRKNLSLTPTASTKSKKIKLEVEQPEEEQYAAEEPISKEAVSALPSGDIEALQEDISLWLQEQQACETQDLSDLLDASLNDEEPTNDVDLERVDVTPSVRLANFSKEEIRKKYKYECEWRKCKFMSGNDRKYYLHVEAHAEQEVDTVNPKTYRCEWDLCDYSTGSAFEFVGHVHYHAYHTQLKVYGASVHLLLKLPNCNYDSRVRNTITNRPVTFRCEWADCNEHINKATHFFYHVKCHVDDLALEHRKRKSGPLRCQWSICDEVKFNDRSKLKHHLHSHTTERHIACFNCGTQFFDRSKYVDHCHRQIDITLRKHRCELCGRMYASLNLLKNHLEYHDAAYACELCPVKYSSKGMLASHVRHAHLGIRDYKCPHCKSAFTSKRDMFSHVLAMHEKKTYRCEEFGCNVVYRSVASLKKHYAWHYDLPQPIYACHLCDTDRQFKQQYELSQHFRYKHDLVRVPGTPRFRYKPDTDGLYRLHSFVDGKNEPKKATQNADSDGTGKAKANEPKPTYKEVAPVQHKLKITSMQSIGVQRFLIELGIDPDEYQPKGAPESAASAAEPDAEKAALETVPPEQTLAEKVATIKQEGRAKQQPDDSGAEPTKRPKDVKDFMVMKRYLKSSEKKPTVA